MKIFWKVVSGVLVFFSSSTFSEEQSYEFYWEPSFHFSAIVSVSISEDFSATIHSVMRKADDAQNAGKEQKLTRTLLPIEISHLLIKLQQCNLWKFRIERSSVVVLDGQSIGFILKSLDREHRVAWIRGMGPECADKLGKYFLELSGLEYDGDFYR